MNHPFSIIDELINHVDQAVRTLSNSVTAARPNPAQNTDDCHLSAAEKKQIAGLMRVNHAGEVAAQALYQGQAITARNPTTREKMQESADEEVDHLAWCHSRLQELGSKTSILAPFWYAGSLCIGAIAGIAGDRWSLGFVAETEHQVMKHLDSHLQQLPDKDQKSRRIIEQMHLDEASHADKAIAAGAAELPRGIKKLMGLMSKVMTRTAYWI